MFFFLSLQEEPGCEGRRGGIRRSVRYQLRLQESGLSISQNGMKPQIDTLTKDSSLCRVLARLYIKLRKVLLAWVWCFWQCRLQGLGAWGLGCRLACLSFEVQGSYNACSWSFKSVRNPQLHGHLMRKE